MVVLKNAPQNIPALLLEAHKFTCATFFSVFPYVLLATLCIAMAHQTPRLGVTLIPSLLVGYGIAMWLLSACVIRMHCVWSQTPCSIYHAMRLATLKILPLLLCLLVYGIIMIAATMAMIVPALFLLFALALCMILLLLQNQSELRSPLCSPAYPLRPELLFAWM